MAMHLPDFLLNASFNDLRRLMGAEELGDFRSVRNAKILTIAELEALIGGGIDLQSLDEIQSLADGTLTYKDRPVVLYIRDVPNSGIDGFELARLHIANCRTLQDMRAQKRFARYVVAARQDGKCQINGINEGSATEASVDELLVCQSCLGHLSGAKGHGDETTAALNDYSGDFGKHAAAAKKRAGFKCEDCGRDLSNPKFRSFLHAHHINGVKYDNSVENLRALCIACHAAQPLHSHMLGMPLLTEYIVLIASNRREDFG